MTNVIEDGYQAIRPRDEEIVRLQQENAQLRAANERLLAQLTEAKNNRLKLGQPDKP